MSLFNAPLNEVDAGLAKIDELAASQKIRLFDIYALGPVLIYAATRKTPLGRWTKRTLFVAGIMTIVYNWKKYRTIDADLKKAVQDAGL
jgi:hypothetical protein